MSAYVLLTMLDLVVISLAAAFFWSASRFVPVVAAGVFLPLFAMNVAALKRIKERGGVQVEISSRTAAFRACLMLYIFINLLNVWQIATGRWEWTALPGLLISAGFLIYFLRLVFQEPQKRDL